VHTNHAFDITLHDGPVKAFVNEAVPIHMFLQCLWHFHLYWTWHDVSVAFSFLTSLWYY